MRNKSKEGQENQIILRQITDHIFQCLNRIEDNINYLVFIRKNSNIRNVSENFYIQQIDRFSRDTIIAFTHMLDKDTEGNTLYSLILKIKDKEKREKMELKFEKLRKNAQTIIFHRNKVVAHHNTNYNSKLGDYYPTQPFSYTYTLNPCFCNRVRLKISKLFWDLKYILDIDGVGGLHFYHGKMEDVFKAKALGAGEEKNSGVIISHKCRYKDCLLK